MGDKTLITGVYLPFSYLPNNHTAAHTHAVPHTAVSTTVLFKPQSHRHSLKTKARF